MEGSILVRWLTLITVMPLVYYLPLTMEQSTLVTGLIIILNNEMKNPSSKRDEDKDH